MTKPTHAKAVLAGPLRAEPLTPACSALYDANGVYLCSMTKETAALIADRLNQYEQMREAAEELLAIENHNHSDYIGEDQLCSMCLAVNQLKAALAAGGETL